MNNLVILVLVMFVALAFNIFGFLIDDKMSDSIVLKSAIKQNKNIVDFKSEELKEKRLKQISESYNNLCLKENKDENKKLCSSVLNYKERLNF